MSRNFYSAYSKHLKVPLDFSGTTTKTEQHHKKACDIKNIIKRYKRDGVVSHMNHAQPQYIDCTGFDFRESLDLVIGVREIFDGLPSKIRNMFNNDPEAFLDALHDPNRKDELVELGLLQKPDIVSTEPAPESVLGETSSESGTLPGGTTEGGITS